MRYLLIVLGCLTTLTAASQQEGQVSAFPDSSGSVRSQYIRSYPNDFFVWPVLKQRKLDFELRSLAGDRNRLQYSANKPYSLGVGLYLFEVAFELAFAVPLDEQSKRIYGESTTRDIQLNILGRRWGADLFWQRYSGLYINDPANPVPTNTPYIQRPDITVRNVGLSVNRVLNSNKFSFRSAYNFVERQLTSAGSPIVFATFDNLIVKADSAIVGDRFAEQFGDSHTIIHIRTSNLGIAPGYTYSLIWKGFFINGAFAIGPMHNWMKYELEDGGGDTRLKFNLYVAARLALGYNGDRFFGGLTFMNHGRNVKFEDVQMTNSQSSFKILFGMRFRESGILKKKIWDLPKTIRK